MSSIKQDGSYDTRTLTKIFCGSSVLLALSVVWMVLDDHHRKWKGYQETFREIEVSRAQADVDEAVRAIAPDAVASIQSELEAATTALGRRADELGKLEVELKKAQAEQERANLDYSIAKSFVESDVFFMEHAGAAGNAAERSEYQERYAHDDAKLRERATAKESAALAVKAVSDRIAGLEEGVTLARKRKDELESSLDRATRKLKAIGHKGWGGFLNDRVRNAPVLDLFDRSLREKQIVLPNLRDDYYFAQVRKVDRCITCHLAIDRKGFDGAIVHVEGKGLVPVARAEAAGGGYALTLVSGQVERVSGNEIKGPASVLNVDAPFKSHPRLDLFVGSASPHPMEKFGCTVCHQGEGESMGFVTASHSPNGEEQRVEWMKKFTWEEREHWQWPQLPTRYVESSCLLCHQNNRPVPGADKLNFGRETFERLSCVGCHKMKGYEDEAKRGPDLRQLTSKLTKDWVAYWIEEPKRFRPKTNMPQFWHLDQPTRAEKEAARTRDPENPNRPIYDYDVRDQVEIRAVTEFLFDRSKAFVAEAQQRGDAFVLPEWKKGDPERGKTLFTARGCVGCHRLEPLVNEAQALRTYAPDEFGPNLWNVAHKTTPAWIQKWVSNPKHYWTDTRMPNLRLNEGEARDVATYLTDGLLGPDGKGNEVKDEALVGFQPLKPVDGFTPAELEQLERACRDFLEKDYATPDVQKMFAGAADPALPSLKDTSSRLLYLGEQTVGRAGCFGCHFVKGMESRPGIGRDLSDVGDKNLNQVLWGFKSVPRFMDPEAKAKEAKGKIRENRHEWLNLKIADPRCFDEGLVRLPLDRSRMPRFNTTRFEREALVTYLLGLTSNRRVPDEYRYKPAVRRASIVEGEYAIYRNNCKACHLFAADQIAVTDKNGAPIVRPLLDARGQPVKSPITGAPLTTKAYLEGHVLLNNLPIYGAEEGAAIIQLYADAPVIDAFPERKQVGDYLAVMSDGSWKSIDEIRSPVVGADADLLKVFEGSPDDVWDEYATRETGADKAPRETPAEHRTRQLAALRKGNAWRNRGGNSLDKIIEARVTAKLGFDPFDISGKAKFDKSELPLTPCEDAKTYGPPHLIGEARKIQPLWLQTFMKNPVELRPFLRPTPEWANGDSSALFAGGPRMPNYALRDGDAQLYSRYFAASEEELRLARVQPELEDIQTKVKAKAPGYRTRLEIQQKVFGAMDSFAVRDYFTVTIVDGVFNFTPRADVSLARAVEEKTDGYLSARESAPDDSSLHLGGPGWYSSAYRMFVDQGINCRTCHFVKGAAPSGTPESWAPEFTRVRERLRPEYVREWVKNPKAIVPGTKMPQLFLPGKNQELLPGSPDVQISAITDWLMAGAPSMLEAFPKSPKAGTEVRITSEVLNLDAVTEVRVREAGGAETVIPGADLLREKSAERTTAIRLPVVASSKGKTFVITVRDGRFEAKVDVPVAAE